MFLCAGTGCKRRTSPAGPEPDAQVALSKRQVSPDGLIAVRFPSTFAVESHQYPDGSTMVLSPVGKAHGTVTFVSKANIALSSEALAEQFYKPEDVETILRKGPGSCAGRPGIELLTTKMVQGFPFVGRRCYAVVGQTGFISAYVVLKEHAAANEPTLRAMVDSAEFLR